MATEAEQRQEKDDNDRIQAALNALSEHFDTVTIFATRHEPGELKGTVRIHKGVGNWFARYGQIRTFIVSEEEVTREQARQSVRKPPEE